MSKALLLLGTTLILGSLTSACAETAKSASTAAPVAAGKLTPSSQETSQLKPLYVGATHQRRLVGSMTKELSLSEGHFSVCWAHRAKAATSWAVIAWRQSGKEARGEPTAFIQCVQSRFNEWFAKLAVTGRPEAGTFYLVEDMSQLGKDQWPPGGERYQWKALPAQGKPTTKEKELKVFQ